MPRTKSGIEGSHNTRQSSVTGMHLSIRQLRPLLMKEETLVKKTAMLNER